MDLIDRAVAVSDTTGFSYCCEGWTHATLKFIDYNVAMTFILIIIIIIIEQHFEILQMLAYRHFQYVCGIHVVGNKMV